MLIGTKKQPTWSKHRPANGVQLDGNDGEKNSVPPNLGGRWEAPYVSPCSCVGYVLVFTCGVHAV